MSTPSADCKKSSKMYECSTREELTKRYVQRYPELTIPRDVWDEAKDKVRAKHPDFEDTLISTGQEPRAGTKKLISSSSSMENISAECCGTKEDNKGDETYLVGRVPVGSPVRRPAPAPPGGIPGEGPKEKMTYKFKYYGPDIARLRSIYLSAKAYYGSLTNPVPPDCCKYVGNPNSTICTASCAAVLVQKVYATLRHLDNLYNSGNWKALVKFCKAQMPVKPYNIEVQRDISTYSFDETTINEVRFKTRWACEENDSRPCCCDCQNPCEENEDCPEGQTCKDGCCAPNSECDCERTCDDLSDCQDNEGCEGNPDCDYSPQGCCKDNCKDKCQGNDDCTEEGETCKNGCCWDGDCRYGEWLPPSTDICVGESFTQTRILLRGSLENCEPKERPSVGTKPCPSTTSSIGLEQIDSLIDSLKSQIIIR